MTPKLRLAITPGAEDGVGPELMARAIADCNPATDMSFFWCGDRSSLSLAVKRARLPITFLDHGHAKVANSPPVHFFGDLNRADSALKRQANFLQKSVDLAKNQEIDAIVTGPIEKAALAFLDDGVHAGQTEYFASHLAKEDRKPFMAFMGGPFIMSLLTTHLALRSVASSIQYDHVRDHLQAFALQCAQICNKKVSEVKICVLGLNPHAGENGLLGTEENKVIKPAILAARCLGLDVRGPVPADGFFAYFHEQTADQLPDAVVACYHDQGLIPYKLLARGSAINVTLGLTIPRTSPAHGTATDLMGKNLASSQSTKMAIKMAIDLAKNNENWSHKFPGSSDAGDANLRLH